MYPPLLISEFKLRPHGQFNYLCTRKFWRRSRAYIDSHKLSWRVIAKYQLHSSVSFYFSINIGQIKKCQYQMQQQPASFVFQIEWPWPPNRNRGHYWNSSWGGGIHCGASRSCILCHKTEKSVSISINDLLLLNNCKLEVPSISICHCSLKHWPDMTHRTTMQCKTRIFSKL